MALGTELGLYSVWNGEPKTFVSKGASELRFTSDSGEADGYTETPEVGRPRKWVDPEEEARDPEGRRRDGSSASRRKRKRAFLAEGREDLVIASAQVLRLCYWNRGMT